MISVWFRDRPIPNLIFDVVIPFGYRSSDEAVLKELEHQVQEKLGEQYHIVVNVDKNYVK